MEKKFAKPRKKKRATFDDGPFCGAPINGPGKRTCRQPAGYRTPHHSQGLCYRHGGCTVMPNGRYANVINKSLKGTLDIIARDEMALMDLAPEATLLRALIIDYVNRYQEFVDALLAWYADGDTTQKPRRVMDLSDAGRLVEAVSRVIHRMHQIQAQGAISMETFRRVTEQMGIVVTRHVSDDTALAKIEAEWGTITVDAKGPRSDSIEDDPID